MHGQNHIKFTITFYLTLMTESIRRLAGK